MFTPAPIGITGIPFTINPPVMPQLLVAIVFQNESPYALTVTQGSNTKSIAADTIDYILTSTSGQGITVTPIALSTDIGSPSSLILTFYYTSDTFNANTYPVSLVRNVTIGGKVDIGTISGDITLAAGSTVDVGSVAGAISLASGTTVDIGSGTVDVGSVAGDISLAPGTTIDVSNISSGNVSIVEGQGGLTNVSTMLPPVSLGSFSVPNNDTATSFTITVPVGTIALKISLPGLGFGGALPSIYYFSVEGTTTGTSYYYTSNDVILAAFPVLIDSAQDITYKITMTLASSGAASKAYVTAVLDSEIIAITNNSNDPAYIANSSQDPITVTNSASNPLVIGGVDSTNTKHAALTDTSGRLQTSDHGVPQPSSSVVVESDLSTANPGTSSASSPQNIPMNIRSVTLSVSCNSQANGSNMSFQALAWDGTAFTPLAAVQLSMTQLGSDSVTATFPDGGFYSPATGSATPQLQILWKDNLAIPSSLAGHMSAVFVW